MKWSVYGKYMFVCISDSDKEDGSDEISSNIYIWSSNEQWII